MILINPDRILSFLQESIINGVDVKEAFAIYRELSEKNGKNRDKSKPIKLSCVVDGMTVKAEISKRDWQEIMEIAKTNMIEAIKRFRAISNLTLRESKEMVEKYCNAPKS